MPSTFVEKNGSKTCDSGAIGNNTVPSPGETLLFTNLRLAVAFYTTPSFAGSPGAAIAPGVLTLTAADISDIAHFLEAIGK